MGLDDLLALLPDNSTGEIGADDLRTIVTELWNYTLQVQKTQNELVVTTIPVLQHEIGALKDQLKIGGVESDGTIVGAPEGWTAVMDEPGLYTVTHNLGVDPNEYAVIITPLAKSVDGISPAVESTSETSFTYGIYSAAHRGLHGCYVNFVVVMK